MKRAILVLASALMMVGSIGCHHNLCRSCNSCGHDHRHVNARSDTHVARLPAGHHARHHGDVSGPAGPPTAANAYPYYTIRAPRDFLLGNPPSIGY